MTIDELKELRHKLEVAWKQVHEFSRLLQQDDFELTLHTNSHLVQSILFNPAVQPSVEAKKLTAITL